MNTPETYNHNPRSFMKHHQFSFRVSKHHHQPNKSAPEERSRRLEFIRHNSASLRRILGGKSEEDQDHFHPAHAFHMHKHHSVTIKSYLGSAAAEDVIPESKEDGLGVHERTDPHNNGMKSSEKKLRAEEQKKKETTVNACFSPFANTKRVIHTIDEMPIPMRKSKRNIFTDDHNDEEDIDQGHIHNKSWGGYNGNSAPDLRQQARPLPPRREQMKRRNSVTKFSASMLNDQFEAATE